jgi:hypothetical protein
MNRHSTILTLAIQQIFQKALNNMKNKNKNKLTPNQNESSTSKVKHTIVKPKNIHKHKHNQTTVYTSNISNISHGSNISTINSNSTGKVNVHSNNYISKLIKLYYNNDDVSNNYLSTAHKMTHMFAPQKRIIVIGDIHGDFEVAIKCLILAKCIEDIAPPQKKTVNAMDTFFNTLKWIGGDTYIVQLGDQIDRIRPQKWDANDISHESAYEDEGSTLEIFYLFHYLNELAQKQGGRVLSILGNHEIMNVDGDFRYVSKKEFHCFKEHLKNIYHRHSKFPYHSKTLKKNRIKLTNDNKNSNIHTKLPIGYKERLYAFSPTGLCANLMARNYYTMLQIGNWLFCHGSPTLHISRNYTIDLVNNIVSLYLLGIESNDNLLEKHFNNIMRPDTNIQPNTPDTIDTPYTSHTLNTPHTLENEKSILWARTFGEKIDTQTQEKQLSELLSTILSQYNIKNNNKLDIMKAKYIAIGHTPQFESGINSICNKKVWRCDIGMSRAFKNNDSDVEERNIQVLEIFNGNAKVLSEH